MRSLPYLPSRIRLILWVTFISAVIGAFYGHINAVMNGSPVLGFDAVPRGILTGFVIGFILVSFEVLIMEEPIGAPLHRTSFPVHVAVKTFIYLIVILFALALG